MTTMSGSNRRACSIASATVPASATTSNPRADRAARRGPAGRPRGRRPRAGGAVGRGASPAIRPSRCLASARRSCVRSWRDRSMPTMIRVPVPGALSIVSMPPRPAARPPCSSGPGGRRPSLPRSKPTPSSLDRRASHRPPRRPQRDRRASRLRVPRDVAERFAGDAGRARTAGCSRRHPRRRRHRVGVDLDHRAQPDLLGERLRWPADEVPLVEQLRPQTHDEVADVADRRLERVDRPIDAGRASSRSSSISSGTSSSDRPTA